MAYTRGSTKKESVTKITNGVLFTRAANIHANKEAPIPSIEGKAKFQVFGKDIGRNTWIYFDPKLLKKKQEKYAKLGQWLYGPLDGNNELLQPYAFDKSKTNR